MAIKKTAGTKSAPLEPKVADKLLDLLSTDNEFRRLFKKDPAAALAKAGHRGPPFTPPGPPDTRPPMNCYRVQYIAPKQEIDAARAELKAYLTSMLAPTNPHCFEAGKVATALKRITR